MANWGGRLTFMFFFRIVLFFLILICFPVSIQSGRPLVPCYFIFGDSLVDNGNNNERQTTAKVNYPPYGIDFPKGPTGRFSNGRNLADFIAEYLGFDDYIPAFAYVKDEEIMRGVNFASGGAGIRSETGRQLGDVISLDEQLANHEIAISRIASLNHGNESFTMDYLTKCIYTVGMGNNDYINNYFAPDHQFYNSSRLYTPDQYASALIFQYSQQLQTLYKLGARKIAVFGLGAIGCTPAEVAMFGTQGAQCVNEINDAVNLFNDKLKPLTDDLNAKLVDAKFIVIAGQTNVPPTFPGLIVSDSPCCQVFKEGGGRGQCLPNLAPCNSIARLQHVFFDGFHPSEAANFLVALSIFPHLLQLLVQQRFGR